MLNRILYLSTGLALGATGHWAYRKYYSHQPNIKPTSRQIIDAYLSKKNLQNGYLMTVLKSLGLFMKGFYHYGIVNKLQGFNFHEVFLDKEQVRNDKLDVTNLYCIFSPNDVICGHPEIQHGGATATIIDQTMGELAILNTKEMVATAQLNIKYKKPIHKDQVYVLEAEVTKKQGRRVHVTGIIRDVQTGHIAVESHALFMIVKWNNQMTRILTKFFQVVNYKDYAEEHHHKIQSEKEHVLKVISQNKHNLENAVEKAKAQDLATDAKLQKLQKVLQTLQKKQNHKETL